MGKLDEMNSSPSNSDSPNGLVLPLNHWRTWAWIIGIFTVVELFQQIQLFLSLNERAFSQPEISYFFSSKLIVREFWEIYSIALLIPIFWAAEKRIHFLSSPLVIWVTGSLALILVAVFSQQMLFRSGLAAINELTGWYSESSLSLILGRWSVIPLLSTAAFYVLILGALIGIDAYQRWQEKEANAALLEKQLSEARLLTLQSQLHPHFLFNTLQTIAAAIHSHPQAAERMTIKIGDLLRTLLRHENRSTISLKTELAFIQDYLEVHEIRFGNNLKIEWEIDPDSLNAEVPTLILQPIIENAIKHGLQSGRGTILLISNVDNGTLTLKVINDGAVVDAAEINPGVGLQNTLERINTLYPGLGSFELSQTRGGRTEATIKIPFRTLKHESQPTRTPKDMNEETVGRPSR